MIVTGTVKKGQYFDSVSLMILAQKIRQKEGITEAAAMMGSRENKTILAASGLLIEAFGQAEDTDLLIAVKAENEELAGSALKHVDEELRNLRKREETETESFVPRSLEGALERLPGANLVLISLPGQYAAAEAMKALEQGLHVMLFSDHVPLEEEIALKQVARRHRLLLMGPDCGSAIINGVPLAFANVVKRGPIGVVAAAGTGLQEVTTLISNRGGGISQAIGTGGRDIRQEVGGMMFMSALEALADDENTRAILLVAKPPHPGVLPKIGAAVKGIKKPVAAVFLGADPAQVKEQGMIPAADLEAGASLILDLAGIKQTPYQPLDIEKIADEEVKKIAQGQKYLRALYSGGTFGSETQVILKDVADVFSNTPTANAGRLTESGRSQKHTVLDLGDDEFTAAKPHPMIDFSGRNRRIMAEAQDKETAVILLDLVLGYGALRSPLPEIMPVIKAARQQAEAEGRYIPFVCSVTGTDEDPQDRSRVAAALGNAGVIVCQANAQAARLCRHIIKRLEG